MTPAQEFAHRIANEVGRREREFMRDTGATWTEAYQSDWDVFHDVLYIASLPDRPAFHEAARIVKGPTT